MMKVLGAKAAALDLTGKSTTKNDKSATWRTSIQLYIQVHRQRTNTAVADLDGSLPTAPSQTPTTPPLLPHHTLRRYRSITFRLAVLVKAPVR